MTSSGNAGGELPAGPAIRLPSRDRDRNARGIEPEREERRPDRLKLAPYRLAQTAVTQEQEIAAAARAAALRPRRAGTLAGLEQRVQGRSFLPPSLRGSASSRSFRPPSPPSISSAEPLVQASAS